MGFTHHNRNLSFKQPGERSGFPGKTYRPLSTTFGGRLSSAATRWAVPWLHLFVCSMGGPSGNQTHNHSPALQIKKCIHTLLSHETTSNQFRRVECTEGLTEGHLGTVTLVASTLIWDWSQGEFTGRTGLSSVMGADEHMWKWSGSYCFSYPSYSTVVWLGSNNNIQCSAKHLRVSNSNAQ